MTLITVKIVALVFQYIGHIDLKRYFTKRSCFELNSKYPFINFTYGKINYDRLIHELAVMTYLLLCSFCIVYVCPLTIYLLLLHYTVHSFIICTLFHNAHYKCIRVDLVKVQGGRLYLWSFI